MGELAEDAWNAGLEDDAFEEYGDLYGDDLDDLYDWGEGDDIFEEDTEGDEDLDLEGF